MDIVCGIANLLVKCFDFSLLNNLKEQNVFFPSVIMRKYKISKICYFMKQKNVNQIIFPIGASSLSLEDSCCVVYNLEPDPVWSCGGYHLSAVSIKVPSGAQNPSPPPHYFEII